MQKNRKVFIKNACTKKRKKRKMCSIYHDLICTVEVKFELFAIVCMNISLISLFSEHYYNFLKKFMHLKTSCLFVCYLKKEIAIKMIITNSCNNNNNNSEIKNG